MVVRIVIPDHADRLEALGQVKLDHVVADAPVEHRLQIILSGAILLLAPRKARHPAAEDDAFQPPFLAQAAADIVEPLADAQTAIAGIDANAHAIEIIAVRIVAGGEAVPGDLVPAMRRQRSIAADDEGGAMADNFIPELGDELPFGKIIDLRAGRAFVVPNGCVVAALAELGDSGNIGCPGQTYDELVFHRPDGLSSIEASGNRRA